MRFAQAALSASFSFILLLGSSAGTSQAKPKAQAKPKQTAFVSQSEMVVATDRVARAINEVLKLQPPVSRPSGISKPQGEATRAQIVAAFDRMFQASRPHFRFKPRPVKYDAARLLTVKPATRHEDLKKLIEWGCVAPVGPLATNKSDRLNLEEFGDALGFFVARIAELTHTPSTKFSPFLMPP